MNLEKKRTLPVFLLGLFLLLTVPVLFPKCLLFFFAPLIVMVVYQRPLHICLWVAFGCGLIVDGLSSEPRIGVYALNYCLTTCCLYYGKQSFFADSQSTLPIMVFLFSLLSTIFQGLLRHIMSADLLLSFQWGFTDLFVMPLLDALYSYLFFILPSLILYGRPRKGSDYFIQNHNR